MVEVHGNRTHPGRYQRPTPDLKPKKRQKTVNFNSLILYLISRNQPILQ